MRGKQLWRANGAFDALGENLGDVPTGNRSLPVYPIKFTRTNTTDLCCSSPTNCCCQESSESRCRLSGSPRLCALGGWGLAPWDIASPSANVEKPTPALIKVDLRCAKAARMLEPITLIGVLAWKEKGRAK